MADKRNDINDVEMPCWKADFFEALFPVDERVLSIPYVLKRPSSREIYLDRILPDRKKTNLEQAFKLLGANIPNSLYKYRTVSEYSLDNFQNDTIWLDYPKYYNDPFDSLTIEDDIIIEQGIKLLANCYGGEPMVQEVQNVFSEDTIERLKDLYESLVMRRTQSTFTVACLSETSSSVLMWSHYASEHKGFCVEYSGREIYQYETVYKHLFPVKYLDEKDMQIPISALALDYSGLYSVLCKTKEWDYEREWRICFGIEDVEGPRNIQLPKATGVYIGAFMSKGDRTRILDIASSKGIPVYQERLNYMNREVYFELCKEP